VQYDLLKITRFHFLRPAAAIVASGLLSGCATGEDSLVAISPPGDLRSQPPPGDEQWFELAAPNLLAASGTALLPGARGPAVHQGQQALLVSAALLTLGASGLAPSTESVQAASLGASASVTGNASPQVMLNPGDATPELGVAMPPVAGAAGAQITSSTGVAAGSLAAAAPFSQPRTTANITLGTGRTTAAVGAAQALVGGSTGTTASVGVAAPLGAAAANQITPQAGAGTAPLGAAPRSGPLLGVNGGNTTLTSGRAASALVGTAPVGRASPALAAGASPQTAPTQLAVSATAAVVRANVSAGGAPPLTQPSVTPRPGAVTTATPLLSTMPVLH
jgi:hypothetical protein